MVITICRSFVTIFRYILEPYSGLPNLLSYLLESLCQITELELSTLSISGLFNGFFVLACNFLKQVLLHHEIIEFINIYNRRSESNQILNQRPINDIGPISTRKGNLNLTPLGY